MTQLTDQEKLVAINIADGKKDVQIAHELCICRRRVGQLIQSIKAKWKVDSRVQIGIYTYILGYYKIERRMKN